MSDQADFGLGTITREENDFKEPPMYKVLLHNDHYTTQEFVVEVLRTVFRKNLVEATRIMLDVHRKGIGTVGTYVYDIARTKVDKVKTLAEQAQYPLRCSMEEA